jgi:predicted transcriptional regulator
MRLATFSMRRAAKLLGSSAEALSQYISAKKIPVPKTIRNWEKHLRVWTEADVERVRKLLPKIENGRKTRYKKQQGAQTKRKPAKKKEAKPETGTRRC